MTLRFHIMASGALCDATRLPVFCSNYLFLQMWLIAFDYSFLRV